MVSLGYSKFGCLHAIGRCVFPNDFVVHKDGDHGECRHPGHVVVLHIHEFHGGPLLKVVRKLNGVLDDGAVGGFVTGRGFEAVLGLGPLRPTRFFLARRICQRARELEPVLYGFKCVLLASDLHRVSSEASCVGGAVLAEELRCGSVPDLLARGTFVRAGHVDEGLRQGFEGACVTFLRVVERCIY